MTESPQRSTWLTPYVLGVIAAGTAVLAWSVYHSIYAPPGRIWFILASLTMATAFANLRMRVIPISFSISEMFTMLAALLFGPEAGALATALDGLTISSRLRSHKLPGQRVLFNATAPPLAMC